MNDRELLELAAKATGIEVWPDIDFQAHTLFTPPAKADPDGKVTGIEWNPLAENGDNRRLQVRLRLGLVPLEGGGWDCYSYTDAGETMLATDMDPNRAVVLAAATIGKEM
ncbi:hypothetical protein [Achromobacter insuavis]|uniref:hypothetical protein n=1 Tax=Achromobacter insuavis TaxID=1287735 RepID=UPI001F12979F|nr:hypothetical protein [Achromobacter insuavis]